MNRNEVLITVLVLLMLLSNIKVYGQGISVKPNEKYNPEYHFYPSFDPTGLFYYGGQYFLNWGVATNKDFVHWKMTDYGLERSKMFGRLRTGGQNAPAQFKPQV